MPWRVGRARAPEMPADFRPFRKSSYRTTCEYLTKESVLAGMSPNKKIIETYLATADRSRMAPLLADDVEWVEWGDGVPASGVITRGKEAYLKNYGDDELRGELHRLTEEGNVVVAEGTAHVTKKDGSSLSVRFVDIFELENGKIKRKSSFGALIKGSS
jgi:uncharacterized protein